MAISKKLTFLFNSINLLNLICGASMCFCGYNLFMDTKRMLISRLFVITSEHLNNLPQPLFFYVAIGLLIGGILAIGGSLLGIWTTCYRSNCCLSVYFLVVILLLLAETVLCLAITLWPHCLGLNMDSLKMVQTLEEFYGMAGKEQFTLAMDLAQTQFGCCGITSETNYDFSQWKLQKLGKPLWVVPLSCCILMNSHNDQFSYLDPRPANETLCQKLDQSEYQQFRYTEPCLKFLDEWFKEQYTIFLTAFTIVAFGEVTLLVCIVFACSSNSKKETSTRSITEAT